MTRRKWSDLTALQKGAICVGGACEVVITVAALRDLAARPAPSVRGPKAAWVAAFAVQPFGPLAYFVAARR